MLDANDTSPPDQTEEFLTTKQVHERYPFLSEGTLRFWRMQGGKQGPPSFVVGRKVLYRASECAKWLAAQEAATIRGGAA